MSQTTTKKVPIFNKEYEVLESLGEGATARVYLCKHVDTGKKIALKLYRQTYLSHDSFKIKTVEEEIQILQGLNHENINSIIGYGSDGIILKPSGREITKLVYIMLEYVSGGILYDLIEKYGPLGENGGRLFMNQLTSAISYMHTSQQVVHRDLKLENILLHDNLQLKIADFGFATFRKITKLQDYKGTQTYMAPEIKEGKVYDGRKSDVFSLGVILFIMVLGIFPFQEAKRGDKFYQLILDGKYSRYWRNVLDDKQNISDQLKDLIISMFSHDPEKRPDIEDVILHPWMQQQFNADMVINDIQLSMQENIHEKATTDTENHSI